MPTKDEAGILMADIKNAKYPDDEVVILFGLARKEGITEFSSSMNGIYKTFYELSQRHPQALEGITFETIPTIFSESFESVWFRLGMSTLIETRSPYGEVHDLSPHLETQAQELLDGKYNSEKAMFETAPHDLVKMLQREK